MHAAFMLSSLVYTFCENPMNNLSSENQSAAAGWGDRKGKTHISSFQKGDT